jgi:cytochrome c-type biogenesis protein
MLLAATSDATRNLYVLTAFGGGVISFLSPCVLPIVPGYLSLVTGLSVGEIQSGDKQPKVLARITLDTVLFVIGFTVVFVLLGLVTTAAGKTLFENQDTLTRISGGLVLLMAAYLAGSQLLTTPRLYQEFRFHPHLERFGPVAAPIAGVAFGLGWTPCIGPILGTVLNFAAQGQNLTRATVLLIAYSLGLGLSFLVVGLLFGRMTTLLGWFRRHARAITFVSAGLLAFFGIELLRNDIPHLTARLSELMDSLGLRSLVDIG